MKTIHQYLESENIQPHIASESIEKAERKFLYIKELHIDYLTFCAIKYLDHVGKIAFSKHLKELGFIIKKLNSGMVVFVNK